MGYAALVYNLVLPVLQAILIFVFLASTVFTLSKTIVILNVLSKPLQVEIIVYLVTRGVISVLIHRLRAPHVIRELTCLRLHVYPTVLLLQHIIMNMKVNAFPVSLHAVLV